MIGWLVCWLPVLWCLCSSFIIPPSSPLPELASALSHPAPGTETVVPFMVGPDQEFLLHDDAHRRMDGMDG
uniref:Putative secreted peptide n=1 Tax=Anopheles braziliensis TaxID=58242 RepID=A0A2M3ZVS8_9DIPT